MAQSFQEMNTMHKIFSDSQKGLIQKTNQRREHGIVLNELRGKARRQRKNLVVTTIDFTSALK
jgi:predicted transcriptional regulator